MSKCLSCGKELEYGAKFCTNCGSEVDSNDNKGVENTGKSAISIAMKILNFFILLIVGFFVFTIFKVLFSLALMLLVSLNIMEPGTYSSISYIFMPVSIMLAIVYTPKINNIKTLKNKIIVIVMIILLGIIGAVLISTSKRMARNNLTPTQHTTYSECLVTDT